MKILKMKVKNSLTTALILTIVIVAALGCDCSFSVGKPKEPTKEEAAKLVKETLKDFTESLEKDDFEIIRRNGSRNFQKQFSAEQIKNTFSDFVEKKELAIPLFRDAQETEPEFSPSPKMNEVNNNYVFETAGIFPAKKQNLNFKFEYTRENGKWKLTRIEIKT